MFSALMKNVVRGNTNGALFANGVNLLLVAPPNTNSAGTKRLPQKDLKQIATPDVRKKRKAEDFDAGVVVQPSKKIKTEEPKQQSEELKTEEPKQQSEEVRTEEPKQKSESEGPETKEPAEQPNPDVVNQTVQSSSNDEPPAPKVPKSRRIKSPRKNKVTPGFDRFREGGIFYSNILPAAKSAEHTKPPVPLFPTESAESVDDGTIHHKAPASPTDKEPAVVTSAEIRAWISPKPNKILTPRDVGWCDKMRLPGTDTKLLPCLLINLLSSKTYEPLSAADQKTVNDALASRKQKLYPSSAKTKPVDPKITQKNKKTDPKSDRVVKKQPKGSEKQKKKVEGKQDSPSRQRQEAAATGGGLPNASPPEMQHSKDGVCLCGKWPFCFMPRASK